MSHLAIRADGNAEIGYGHLVRTNVLAVEFLKREHDVTYLTRTPTTVSSVCEASVEIVDVRQNEIAEILSWLSENDVDVLLTDSYRADTEYQQTVSDSAPILATITDDTRFELCCDLNINGNVHAPDIDYDWTDTKPEMLVGTEYLLLRDAFRKLVKRNPPWRDEPARALVTFGGSDMNNSTPSVVRSFDGSDIEVDVIIGPGFTNEAEIASATQRTDAEFNLLRDPDNLPQLMFDADFAVSAVGSTVYELLVTGTPVIGIPQTRNQVPITDGLSSREAIIPVKTGPDTVPHNTRSSADPQLLNINLDTLVEEVSRAISRFTTDTELRRQLRDRGLSLIDGDGSARIYNEMEQLINHG